MSDPIIEQLIIDQVVARMKTIQEGDTVTLPSRDHTYQTTVKTVDDGRVTQYNSTEFIAINVVTASGESAEAGPAHHDHQLKLVLIVYAADAVTATKMRKLIADIYACVEVDETWGLPQVIRTEDPAYMKKIIAGGEFLGAAHIAVTIHYRTLRWQL
jgi:hypothetical protein